MLPERGKSELELSMEHGVFDVEEMPQVVESFLSAQDSIQRGNLEFLISGLNKLHGRVFKERFEEQDFKDAIFMTHGNVLAGYTAFTGFYPFAVGFIFPDFWPIANKPIHTASETRGFYIVRNAFTERPFSDTGITFVDRHQLERTFMHYHELTSSTQFQYSRSHGLKHFRGPDHLLQAYELELGFLREMLSVYVQNKASAIFNQARFENWASFWDSIKQEWISHYLSFHRKMINHFGGSIPQELEEDLTKKINDACDLMKSLPDRTAREMTNIFFRLGTLPKDMEAGRLYSPINDFLVYFGQG